MAVEEDFVFGTESDFENDLKPNESETPATVKVETESTAKTEKIKWGTIIPLIGGSAIGCQKSSGSMPEFHLSYSPFSNNEQHIKRYWPKVPFHYLDKNPVVNFEGVDYINSVCPCAGLSMLNTSTAKGNKRGSDSAANKWMLDSSIFVLSKVRPKVLWGENAPGLFTNIGEGVIQKLREIGQQFGYSFSVMKTSTEMHGIPQRRVRTFYFFWNTPTVPMMVYQKKERKDLLSYLKEIPKDATQQDMFMAKGKASERFRPYQFVLEREGLTHAEFGRKHGKGTISGYLEENDLIDECIEWLEEKYPGEAFWNQKEGTRTHVEYLQHIVKKRQGGLGYWDDSPRFMDGDSFAAVMKKTMMWAVHPEEDRFLNAREFMHLMGLPHDFEIDDVKNLNHIAQNVPTNTARDMAEQVKMFLRGELEMTDYSFAKQDNMTRSLVHADKGYIKPVSKDDIIEMERNGALKIIEIMKNVEMNVAKIQKEKKEKKVRVPLTEEEIEIRRIEREMANEKYKEIKRKEKEERARKREELRAGKMLSPEELAERLEKQRKWKEENEAKREERRKENEKMREERRLEKEKRRAERRESNKPEPVDLEEVTEEMKKFMCYICKIFPRPGSYNRSELYRHYALVHYAQDMRKDYLEKYSFPCPCPFCPEPARMLEGKDIVNHIGQVHSKVEDYLPAEYHLTGGIAKRRISSVTASIKMEIEENLVKEGALIKKEEIKEEKDIKEEKMDDDDSTGESFKHGKIKSEIKKEDNEETNASRRRSSRRSKEAINYDEDVLLEKCEKKVKEEHDKKKKKLRAPVSDDESDQETGSILEKVDEDEPIGRTRSGRKGKSTNRRLESSESEEEAVEEKKETRKKKKSTEVKKIVSSDSEEEFVKEKKEPTRKKRKSTEMEKEVGQDDENVKRTRSGRIVRTLISMKQATSTRSF